MKKSHRGFTLIELLTVAGLIALLLAVLLPALTAAKQRSKIVTVNVELNQIGLALEAYGLDHKGNYPPTRADCNQETRKHWWALPPELADLNYLAKGSEGLAVFSDIEDKFNRGCTYKYVAVGKRLDFSGTPTKQRLMVPQGFPNNSPSPAKYITYSDPVTSPVTWCLFSVGPKFDENDSIQDGFPVDTKFWYQPKKQRGIITRLRLKNGSHLGTFSAMR